MASKELMIVDCCDDEVELFHLHQPSDDVSSTDESDDDEIEAVLISLERGKRSSVVNYFTITVPLYTETEFIKHFRVNRETFKFLCTKLAQSEDYGKLKLNTRIKSSDFHILVFLWYVGHKACSYSDISNRFNITISSVHRILRRAILFVSSLSTDIIKFSNNAEMVETAEFYLNKYAFPGVIGSVDGTHIRINPSVEGKDEYINRKGDISLHLQIVCNSKKKIIHMFTGYPGSVHDSRVFKNSDLEERLSNLPKDKHVLGDSAYICTEYLLTPYRDNGYLSVFQKKFNHKLSQCRVDVENTIGILKQRFRVLYYCKLKGIKYICHLIRACCVLHNLGKEDNFEPQIEDEPRDQQTDQLENINRDTALGKAHRDKICAHLSPRQKKRL